ncbi:hypothetical protein M441DRAFT_281033 [Trichoderma asperellum CBS 433.97]|uniref:Uncharacterized protein n=1 Tax=Trichoderma asperellum (strain ATCC 204424 / CBS 433.97 / NBRC 101777) TaxID=1042311 RepID=A0A2T3YVH5_TRIA4|nr:hypothetical protein M441DRAFT_281033 [Trichoderma asperellum CBS 433.97]PTB36544.1 hypothetical protein M441DRAFT_281033 [Trichoderma asperellum CBS 433.97]
MVMVPDAPSPRPKTKLQFTGPLQGKLRPGLALSITVSRWNRPLFARHSALDPAAAAAVLEPWQNPAPTSLRLQL